MIVNAGSTETLAAFAVDTTFDDLVPSCVVAAQRLILDTLGCAVGGHRVPSAEILRGVRIGWGGAREATVLVDGARLPCPATAAVNAHAANALDSEETILHSGHLAAAVVPPALAVAEWCGSTGRDLLAAVAVAFDVAARIGLSLEHLGVDDEGQVRIAPVSGLSWASFAATTATARLLGLDAGQTADAFGITVASAPLPIGGRWGILASPRPMTKYGLYGAMAEAGVSAAILAAAGFDGDRTILDGDRGFWRMMGSRGVDRDGLTAGLGQRWLVEETSYKLVPACQWAVPALELFSSLLGSAGWSADEVDDIEVLVPEAAIVKFMDRNDVATVVDGQFSIPHLLALAARCGPPSPRWHTTDAVADVQVRDFARRVRVAVNPDAEAVMREQMERTGHVPSIPTVVTITAGGSTVSACGDHARGDSWAGAPASDADLVAKFTRFCEPYLPHGQIDRAVAIVGDLAHRDVDDLVAALVAPHP